MQPLITSPESGIASAYHHSEPLHHSTNRPSPVSPRDSDPLLLAWRGTVMPEWRKVLRAGGSNGQSTTREVPRTSGLLQDAEWATYNLQPRRYRVDSEAPNKPS